MYMITHYRGKATIVQPLHTTPTDSLTHFLEESVCTLALSVIFNSQDGFVAFVCHRTTGSELRAL